MSRLGKLPVEIPSGVQVAVVDGVVKVQGSKGTLEFRLGRGITATVKDGSVAVTRTDNDRFARANHGTARAVISNMITGVSQGWKKSLELHGVGYNAALSGQTLTLNVGLSHSVVIELPKEVSCRVGKNTIDLESCNKELVGDVAAKIRSARPPEPYLGKGVRLAGEHVRRKAGKTG